MKNAYMGLENLGTEGVDAAMKAANALTKGVQAIAEETADYSRRSLDAGVSAFEKLAGAKSLEAAVQLQSDYARAAYEGYVGQMTRVGEIVGQIAREAAEPYSAYFGKAGK